MLVTDAVALGSRWVGGLQRAVWYRRSRAERGAAGVGVLESVRTGNERSRGGRWRRREHGLHRRRRSGREWRWRRWRRSDTLPALFQLPGCGAAMRSRGALWLSSLEHELRCDVLVRAAYEP